MTTMARSHGTVPGASIDYDYGHSDSGTKCTLTALTILIHIDYAVLAVLAVLVMTPLSHDHQQALTPTPASGPSPN
jgi:hypothetical protein